MKKIMQFILICSGLYLLSCTPPRVTNTTTDTAIVMKMPDEEDIEMTTDAEKILEVQVKSENVRDVPNGKKLGQLSKGERIKVVKRVGNWVQFTHAKYKNAYIWAPSVGYTYQNLYSPFFYYDTTQKTFREIAFFQNIFSQKGQRRQETNTSYELFFKDLGLGSHESVVLDAVTESQQVVEHGVTLFVNKIGETVEKVKVDYYKPIKGYESALKKSELPIAEPGNENSGHLIWEAKELIPELTVDLERKEWESPLFTSIWYILPEKKEEKVNAPPR